MRLVGGLALGRSWERVIVLGSARFVSGAKRSRRSAAGGLRL